MYEDFTQERIADLRVKSGFTARDMSLSLGQNPSYINRIENKKSLPSLAMLFEIMRFLSVTPQEFFVAESLERYEDILGKLKLLDDKALSHLTDFLNEMIQKQK